MCLPDAETLDQVCKATAKQQRAMVTQLPCWWPSLHDWWPRSHQHGPQAHLQLQHDDTVGDTRHRHVAAVGDEVWPHLLQRPVHAFHRHLHRRGRLRIAWESKNGGRSVTRSVHGSKGLPAQQRPVYALHCHLHRRRCLCTTHRVANSKSGLHSSAQAHGAGVPAPCPSSPPSSPTPASPRCCLGKRTWRGTSNKEHKWRKGVHRSAQPTLSTITSIACKMAVFQEDQHVQCTAGLGNGD